MANKTKTDIISHVQTQLNGMSSKTLNEKLENKEHEDKYFLRICSRNWKCDRGSELIWGRVTIQEFQERIHRDNILFHFLCTKCWGQ